MVPSGILDGDAVWEEPISHRHNTSSHQQRHLYQPCAPIRHAHLSPSFHPHSPGSSYRVPGSLGFPPLMPPMNGQTKHPPHINQPYLGYTRKGHNNTLTHAPLGHDLNFNLRFSSTEETPAVVRQAWDEGQHTQSNGDPVRDGAHRDLWHNRVHPVSLPTETQSNVLASGERSIPHDSGYIGSKDFISELEHLVSLRKASSNHRSQKRHTRRRSSRRTHHGHHHRHAHHTPNHVAHSLRNVHGIPVDSAQLRHDGDRRACRHQTPLYVLESSHRRHRHQHSELRDAYIPPMIVDTTVEKPARKEWLKERNRNGYRTRRSGSRPRHSDDEYGFDDIPYQEEYQDASRNGGLHSDLGLSGETADSPAPSNDFMHMDPAIHSVTFKRPNDSPHPSSSSSVGKNNSPFHGGARASSSQSSPSKMSNGNTDRASADVPPGSRNRDAARVRKRGKGYRQDKESDSDFFSDLQAPDSPRTQESLSNNSKSGDETLRVFLEDNLISSDVHTTAQILREQRANSEFIAGIERDVDAEKHMTAVSRGDINDPLSALARIEPLSDKLPTTLQDDRARDKTIFQDEEFRHYRENNMPLGAHRDGAEIRHVRSGGHRVVSWVHGNDDEDDDFGGDTRDVGDVVSPVRLSRHHRPAPRMNYFVALRITNAKIKKNIAQLQQRLVAFSEETAGRIRSACVDVSTAHITLNLLHLSDDDVVFDVMSSFRHFGQTTLQRLVPTKTSARLTVSGVSTFHNRVLYASIVHDEHSDVLQNIAIALRTMFNECGVTRQSSTFEPHLTLMKMSRASRSNSDAFSREVIDYAKASVGYFGFQCIHSLELCSMVDDRDADDYYTTVATIAPLKAI